MKVPLLDVCAQNSQLSAELQSAFERVLNSGQMILGAELRDFENRVADFAGAAYGIGVSSGTDAILLALMALEIGAGDEVICPSFTFFATAGCIARTGARPVFVDSCPVCFNIDPTSVESKITERTRAIMPVHLFGQMAEMDEISAIAARHNLPIIEDAAQSLGAKQNGKGAGSIGTFGTYSFYPSKNLGGFGDSGLLVTNDPDLAEKARVLRNHGAQVKYLHNYVGGNFRMDTLQAALLNVKFTHLAAYGERRRENAEYYSQQLSRLLGAAPATLTASCCHGDRVSAERFPGAFQLVLPISYDENEHIWNQYTLRVIAGDKWTLPESPRDLLRAHLTQCGIGTEIYYPLPLHEQKCFAPLVPPGLQLPVCSALAQEVISIPVYPELTREQQDFVLDAIRRFQPVSS